MQMLVIQRKLKVKSCWYHLTSLELHSASTDNLAISQFLFIHYQKYLYEELGLSVLKFLVLAFNN